MTLVWLVYVFGLIVIGDGAKYDFLEDDLTSTVHEDLLALVGSIASKAEPVKVGLIFDSIFKQHITSNFLRSEVLLTICLDDAESFETEPSESIQDMMFTLQKFSADFFVILITNGVQMADFLRYADDLRVLNSQTKIVTLHDYRLFTPDMKYLWRRLVNVIFIRRDDLRGKMRFELSTVPFLTTAQDLFVLRVINFWAPPNRYQWKRNIFENKMKQNTEERQLNVAVSPHTPAVIKFVNENSSDEFYGLEIDIIKTFGSKYNFKLNFYEASDSSSEQSTRQEGSKNFSGLL
jgi:hypothetical protein